MAEYTALSMKRLLDMSTSVVLLLMLSPIMAIVAVCIMISYGKPILFRQSRPGKDGKLFMMCKFRTMSDARIRTANFSRFTTSGSTGQIPRKSSLDELPELFNVIKGEMSLVGPRPLLPEYLPLYDREQARRHEVRPGITGWAQVKGRNSLAWKDKFELDVWYVDNRSIWLDIRILFMTIVQVFKAGDVNQSGQATMSKFTGNT